MSQRCESFIAKATETKKTFYNRQMQQEIIIQTCCKINKGNKFRAMQLGMFHNIVPKLFAGDHASAEQRWKVLAQMWDKRKTSKKEMEKQTRLVQSNSYKGRHWQEKGAVLKNQNKKD